MTWLFSACVNGRWLSAFNRKSVVILWRYPYVRESNVYKNYKDKNVPKIGIVLFSTYTHTFFKNAYEKNK